MFSFISPDDQNWIMVIQQQLQQLSTPVHDLDVELYAIGADLVLRHQEVLEEVYRRLVANRNGDDSKGVGDMDDWNSELEMDIKVTAETLSLIGRGREKENSEEDMEQWNRDLLDMDKYMKEESVKHIGATTDRARENIRARPVSLRAAAMNLWSRIVQGFFSFWRSALDWINKVFVGLVKGVRDMWICVKECFAKISGSY